MIYGIYDEMLNITYFIDLDNNKIKVKGNGWTEQHKFSDFLKYYLSVGTIIAEISHKEPLATTKMFETLMKDRDLDIEDIEEDE